MAVGRAEALLKSSAGAAVFIHYEGLHMPPNIYDTLKVELQLLPSLCNDHKFGCVTELAEFLGGKPPEVRRTFRNVELACAVYA